MKEYNKMTPYELGETGNPEALQYLKAFLEQGTTNERRLAASAVSKLASKDKNAARALIPHLFENLTYGAAQVRQYSLKALAKFKLSEDQEALVIEAKKNADDSVPPGRFPFDAMEYVSDTPMTILSFKTVLRKVKKEHKLESKVQKISSWLVNHGLLTEEEISGRIVMKATEEANTVGITSEFIKYPDRSYYVNYFDENAQKYILEHFFDPAQNEKTTSPKGKLSPADELPDHEDDAVVVESDPVVKLHDKHILISNSAMDMPARFFQENETYTANYAFTNQILYQNALESGDFVEAERLFNDSELTICKQQHQFDIENRKREHADRIIVESRKNIKIMDAGCLYSPSKITSIVNKRKINHLVHFTKVENLMSILQHGLVPVRLQEELGIGSNRNDHMRYDQIDTATSLSVDFPNYKVLYSFRSKLYQDDLWVIIKLKPSVLVSKENKAYFCQTNAANRTDRKMGHTHEAFESMFAATIITKEGMIVQREDLSIPDNWTTDPQAEVLVDGIIDPSHIDSVVFERKVHFESLSQKEQQRISNDHKIEISLELFSYRQDYKFWKSSTKENQYG